MLVTLVQVLALLVLFVQDCQCKNNCTSISRDRGLRVLAVAFPPSGGSQLLILTWRRGCWSWLGRVRRRWDGLQTKSAWAERLQVCYMHVGLLKSVELCVNYLGVSIRRMQSCFLISDLGVPFRHGKHSHICWARVTLSSVVVIRPNILLFCPRYLVHLMVKLFLQSSDLNLKGIPTVRSDCSICTDTNGLFVVCFLAPHI
jgi:hypothetical protein